GVADATPDGLGRVQPAAARPCRRRSTGLSCRAAPLRADARARRILLPEPDLPAGSAENRHDNRTRNRLSIDRPSELPAAIGKRFVRLLCRFVLIIFGKAGERCTRDCTVAVLLNR